GTGKLNEKFSFRFKKDASDSWTEELASPDPSGRWQLFSGNSDEGGDYVTRQLLLFDRKTGHLFPVVKGAWPKPISAQKLRSLDSEGMSKLGALDVAGESDVRWLGPEMLLIDTTLICVGQPSVELHGDVAF